MEIHWIENNILLFFFPPRCEVTSQALCHSVGCEQLWSWLRPLQTHSADDRWHLSVVTHWWYTHQLVKRIPSISSCFCIAVLWELLKIRLDSYWTHTGEFLYCSIKENVNLTKEQRLKKRKNYNKNKIFYMQKNEFDKKCKTVQILK